MMPGLWSRIAESLRAGTSVAMVSVVGAAGSTPREAGARLVLRPDGFFGTIGGGALEHEALAAARRLLDAGHGAELRSWPLGPDLGQCCGGRVTLLTEVLAPADLPAVLELAGAELRGPFETWTTVGEDGVRRRMAHPAARPPAGVLVERFGEDVTRLLLFGAGHVGRAVVLALAPLPFRIRWIDARPDAFPAMVPGAVETVVTSDPVSEIDQASAGAFVLVMTHSHPLDLAIVSRALARTDFGYVGLIGSETKRARFSRQLRGLGLAPDDLTRLVCPIGVPGIEGKEPAIIAVSVAAQLLQVREQSIRPEAEAAVETQETIS
jgi:xanthine dehydrogenase accessory factor